MNGIVFFLDGHAFGLRSRVLTELPCFAFLVSFTDLDFLLLKNRFANMVAPVVAREGRLRTNQRYCAGRTTRAQSQLIKTNKKFRGWFSALR